MSPSYFQVYKTEPSNKSLLKDNSLVYEDENCKVSYDFWSENGNIGFRFFNKTNGTINLNLKESYFILNGIAHNYYLNRTFTDFKNTGVSSVTTMGGSKSVTGINYLNLLQTNKLLASSSTGVSSGQGYSIAYNEEPIVSIPSNTSKIINEYSINNLIYRDCDLYKYPTKKQIKTISFTKSTSPIVFSNRIVYLTENSVIPTKFENEFYVTEITNYSESDITDKKVEQYCNQKGSVPISTFKDISPVKFYVKYTKGMDSWVH
jgi:hypothetical protein